MKQQIIYATRPTSSVAAPAAPAAQVFADDTCLNHILTSRQDG